MNDLFCAAWGRPTAPVVLLLHGFMGQGSDWSLLAERLQPDYRIFAPDLPGHGSSRSSNLMEFDGLSDALVVDLPRRFRIVGYSMGGRLAGHLANRHPGRVEGLVLESAHPGLVDPAERAARVRLDRERADAIRRDFPAFLAAWYRQPLFSSLDEIDRSRLLASRSTNEPNALARALEAFSTGLQPPFGERLRASRVCTLAIAGALDLVYAERAVRLARGSANVSACIIPEAGHAVHVERPDRFANVVHDFFSNPSHPFPCP